MVVAKCARQAASRAGKVVRPAGARAATPEPQQEGGKGKAAATKPVDGTIEVLSATPTGERARVAGRTVGGKRKTERRAQERSGAVGP